MSDVRLIAIIFIFWYYYLQFTVYSFIDGDFILKGKRVLHIFLFDKNMYFYLIPMFIDSSEITWSVIIKKWTECWLKVSLVHIINFGEIDTPFVTTYSKHLNAGICRFNVLSLNNVDGQKLQPNTIKTLNDKVLKIEELIYNCIWHICEAYVMLGVHDQVNKLKRANHIINLKMS